LKGEGHDLMFQRLWW